VYVRHNVVAQVALQHFRARKVYVVRVRRKLVNLSL
jgi:hypothetical protein